MTAILARMPGIAGRRQNLDHALADFGHLELEQLDQEFRRGARQKQLRAARLGAHLPQEGLDAILGLELLAHDHVAARHEAFGVAAEIDVDAVAVDALDDAADQRADAVLVLLDHLRALGLAHLLHDDLLGLLRGDAAEGRRFHRLLDVQARRGGLVDVQPVLEAQFGFRILDLARIVGEHLPAAEGLVVAGLAIDGDAHVPQLAVLAARGGRERGFERLEDDFLVDALLVRDGIDHQQDFLVHRFLPLMDLSGHSGTSRARKISA